MPRNELAQKEKSTLIFEMFRNSNSKRWELWKQLLQMEEKKVFELSRGNLIKILRNCFEVIPGECDKQLLFEIMCRVRPKLQKIHLIVHMYNSSDFLYQIFLEGLEQRQKKEMIA